MRIGGGPQTATAQHSRISAILSATEVQHVALHTALRPSKNTQRAKSEDPRDDKQFVAESGAESDRHRDPATSQLVASLKILFRWYSRNA